MKIHSIDGCEYRLPNELNDFQLDMYTHLINWKWEHITRAPGYHRHRGEFIPYDAIFPESFASEELMPHIYPPVRRHLAAHRERNSFRIHPHFYHMSSSQAANINFFLPILHHPSASVILRELNIDFESLATDQLDGGYCLEFWGGNFCLDQPEKGLLGDKSPRAGTDADIAIAYRNHQGELCLWLIEHKLTEKEFTDCGGFRSKGRTDKLRHDCTRNFAQILTDKSSCYYHDKCGYTYWDITARHSSFFTNHSDHLNCPFQGGMNQLWRNQLLALAIEEQGTPFKHAHFSVVRHPGNTALNPSLDAYKELIGHNPKFSVIDSNILVEAAERHADDQIREWCAWYRDVYNLPGANVKQAMMQELLIGRTIMK